MSMPVTEELTQRSPSAIAEKGIANSTKANTQSAHLCWPRERSAPRCHAIGNKIKVASETRPQAMISGDSSGTANLTKKYGSPQIIPSAANAIQLRQLTVCSSNARHTQDRDSARHYKRLHRSVLTPSGPTVTKSSAVTDIRLRFTR